MGKGKKQVSHDSQVGQASKVAVEEKPLGKDGLNVNEDCDEDYQPVDYSNAIISKQTSLTLLYLMLYSTLMFTLPFGAFYCARYTLDHYFNVTGFANTATSVLAAVLTVNGIICAYAYQAYHEVEYDNEGNRLDPSVATVPKTKKKKTKASKDL